MKNIFINLFLAYNILFANIALGQQKQTFNYDNEFNYNLEWRNKGDEYFIKLTRGSKSDSFTIQPLRPATFTTAFIDAFESILDNTASNNSTEIVEKKRRKISNQANEVLFYIQAQSVSELEYRPKAGEIKIAEEVPISKFTRNWQLTCAEIKKCGKYATSEYKTFADRCINISKTINNEETFILGKVELEGYIIELEQNENLRNEPEVKEFIRQIKEILNKDLEKAKYTEEINKLITYINDNTKKCKDITPKEAKELFYKRYHFLSTSAKTQYVTELLKSERNGDLEEDKLQLEFLGNLLKQTEDKEKNFVSAREKNNENQKETNSKLSQAETYIKNLYNDIAKCQKLIQDVKKIEKKIQDTEKEIETNKAEIKKLNANQDTINTLENEKFVVRFFVTEKILVEDISKNEKIDTSMIKSLLSKNKSDLDNFFIKNFKYLKEGADKNSIDFTKIYTEISDKIHIMSTNNAMERMKELRQFSDNYDAMKKRYNNYSDSINIINLYLVDKKDTLVKINLRLDSIKTSIINLKKELNEINDSITTIKQKKERIKTEIKSVQSTMLSDSLVITSVQVEFYEGFIENIWVVGHTKLNSQKTLKFQNVAPIHFSSKNAYEKNNSVYLTAASSEDEYWVLYLGNLIDYLQNHDSGTKDYSPANGAVLWNNFKEAKILYKKATSEVFEAHVFSDFVGFDSKAPNGLIQTEIDKRFNIYTRKFGSFLSKDDVYCDCHGPKYGANWGFMNFIKPSFVFSKFEEKNRNLDLKVDNKIINGQLQSIKFISTQSLLQYEMFNIGATINAISLDMPLAKSILLHNMGFAYGRTQLTDSIYQYKDNIISVNNVNYYGANTFRFFAELSYIITPEKRYGVETSIRITWLKGFTDQTHPFLQLNEKNQVSSTYDTVNEWMLRFEVSGFFRPSKDSENKIFLRYRFNAQLNDFNYSFHQLQVGYSFYLLRNNITNSKGPVASKL